MACCQIAPDVADPARNAELAREALAGALAAGAQIVVLPELVNSGYVFRSAVETEAAAVPGEGGLLAEWAEQAARADAVVVAGFCERAADGRIFNSAAIVDGGGVLAVYRKLHLWDDERRWFTPGDQPAPVVDTRHGRIGLAICYDLEFPEVARGLALAGAELIALPTNWPRDPDPPNGHPILASLTSVTAYLNKVFVAVCDRCGTERGLEFEGGSVIASPEGRLLAGPVPDHGTTTLQAECDLSQAQNKRTGTSNDAFADRRPDFYTPALLYSEAKLTAP